MAVILRWIREETPPEIEQLVRVAVETGAALSGTLQTENIGLEKVICNLVSNPNIRYLIVCGPESPGHLVGGTILALAANGIDKNKRIIGSEAPTPYLFNIPTGHVERFRKQITVIDLLNEGSPEVLRQAVWSCYQEESTLFRGIPGGGRHFLDLCHGLCLRCREKIISAHMRWVKLLPGARPGASPRAGLSRG